MIDQKKKIAFITGITGQDGSYLAELLSKKNYEVHGLIRRSSTPNKERISGNQDLILHYGDLDDSSSIAQLVKKIQPDEIYNLGAQSHVGASFDIAEYTGNVTGLGVARLLEAIRSSNKSIKLYQASSSEMFGDVAESPQKETTIFRPRSPYGCAKLYAYWLTANYRESYDMFICNGICFNHESPRRGEEFVTRKITKTLAKVALGKRDSLCVGNLEAKRDWGYAPEYVEAMWLMLQQPEADDYVIATGEAHSVREFVEAAATALGFQLIWQGSGLDEIGIDQNTGKTIVKIDKRFFRPAEVDLLMGDCSKAKEKLGWQPKILFTDLVKKMAEADLALESEK